MSLTVCQRGLGAVWYQTVVILDRLQDSLLLLLRLRHVLEVT